MIRTIISLEEEDKRWLEQEAVRERIPVTELVRRAVRLMREQRGRLLELDHLLTETAGSLPAAEAVVRQGRLREEWER